MWSCQLISSHTKHDRGDVTNKDRSCSHSQLTHCSVCSRGLWLCRYSRSCVVWKLRSLVPRVHLRISLHVKMTSLIHSLWHVTVNLHLLSVFNTCFCAVPDFGIDVLSTNGSQEPHGPGLLKVSGLERSQERSQESCRDSQLPVPSTPNPPLSPPTLPVSLPQPQPSIPQTPSPLRTQPNGPTQPLNHLPPRSEALPRPQSPAALPLAQGQEPSPTPPPRHQHQPEVLSHPRPPPTPSLHPHPPSPALPNHHSHQQHPIQSGSHRPPSRCHPRPLSAYNSLSLNGHR